MQKMFDEKDKYQKDLSDLRQELNESFKKIEKLTADQKKLHAEHEKLKSDHFITERKLKTAHLEYGAETTTYRNQIEELENKLSAMESKLKNIELDKSNHESDDEEERSNVFEFRLPTPGKHGSQIGDFLQVSGGHGSNHLDSSREDSRPGSIRGSRLIRTSVVYKTGILGLGESPTANQLVANSKVRELTDKISEMQQSLDDSKLACRKLQDQLAEVQNKLKEEVKKLEIAKKKCEAKDEEIDSYIKCMLVEREKFTVELNDMNDENDKKSARIKSLRQKLKGLVEQLPKGTKIEGKETFVWLAEAFK